MITLSNDASHESEAVEVPGDSPSGDPPQVAGGGSSGLQETPDSSQQEDSERQKAPIYGFLRVEYRESGYSPKEFIDGVQQEYWALLKSLTSEASARGWIRND